MERANSDEDGHTPIVGSKVVTMDEPFSLGGGVSQARRPVRTTINQPKATKAKISTGVIAETSS